MTWDASSNPPETQAFLVIRPENGNPTRLPLPGVSGTTIVALGNGRPNFTLLLERELNGNVYTDKRDLPVREFADGDEWMFTFETEPHYVDGIVRWTAELNLFSAFISNTLRVKEIDCTLPGASTWLVRNPDFGDIKFTAAQPQQSIPSLPVFNK